MFVVEVSETEVAAEEGKGVVEMEFEEMEMTGLFVWRNRVAGNEVGVGARGSTRGRMEEWWWRDCRVWVAI